MNHAINFYRVHMAGTPAAWIDIPATSYTLTPTGLIRFNPGRPHTEGPVFVAANVFAIEPLSDAA